MKMLRRDQMLMMAIFAVIILTFVLVIYLPCNRELRQLETERDGTSDTLNRDHVRVMELAQLRGEVKRMGDRLKFFNQRLPDQQELGQFLKDVSSYARSAGLEGGAIKPQAVQPDELYLQMPIDMRYSGNFMELFRFLRQAREMPRLTHVRSLTVDNSKALNGQCEIEMTMSIYFTRG